MEEEEEEGEEDVEEWEDKVEGSAVEEVREKCRREAGGREEKKIKWIVKGAALERGDGETSR